MWILCSIDGNLALEHLFRPTRKDKGITVAGVSEIGPYEDRHADANKNISFTADTCLSPQRGPNTYKEHSQLCQNFQQHKGYAPTIMPHQNKVCFIYYLGIYVLISSSYILMLSIYERLRYSKACYRSNFNVPDLHLTIEII